LVAGISLDEASDAATHRATASPTRGSLGL
jgi:hypothetical protein